ncbi:MAG: prolyl oligopeptidase family serine peptidase [Thermoplasmata archaeon]
MVERRVAPYGSWKSPVTTDLIVADIIGFGDVAVDGSDIYWNELRPQEGGRNVIVRRTPDGSLADVTPPEFNARTRVHEYGGGAMAVLGGIVYFSNFADQRLYRQEPGSEPQALTPEQNLRYADGVIDPQRGLMYCVREDHREEGREAVNTLVALSLKAGGPGSVIASGNDFYSSPRLSPDGLQLAWLTWNHPNMPWDGTELWVGALNEEGFLIDLGRVAGGARESVFQPEWSPDGLLHFTSDRTGWWNLYRWLDGETEALHAEEAEFGRPQWVFGMATYGFESAHRIIGAYTGKDGWRVGRLDTQAGTLEPFNIPYREVQAVMRIADGAAIFVAGSPTEPWSMVRLDLESGSIDVLRRSTNVGVDTGYLSAPRAIEFPTEGGLTAHAFFYPPRNRDHDAPEEERPPLIVMSHGGPTSASPNTLLMSIQYWTSRGFGVLDVNYGGSTGFGREYRERLNGQWGIVDVNDCVNGARYLVRQGEADRERLAIRGGSAGGYTTLSALTFRDTFKAGASYFGVSDLEALAKETHKFESRYLDRLVGPYPKRRDLYEERSPIHFTHKLSCPVILFQGLEDEVVPPNQAELMVEGLRAKGVPVAYVAFEGEQHGFRKAENIKRALDAELYFYSRIFAFDLAEPVESVPIENLRES